MESFEGTTNYYWAIIISDLQKRHIGNISVFVDVNNEIADISIMLGEKDLWGNGYGSEAFIGVINFLFKEIGIRKVTAGTMDVNRAMIKIMEKAMMKEDGRRFRHYVYQGKEVDLIYASIFREDWIHRSR